MELIYSIDKLKSMYTSAFQQDTCYRNQRSMSLGGPAHESLLSKHPATPQQPPQTVEMSRAENGLFMKLKFKIINIW